MQSTATWALGSVATRVPSTRTPNNSLAAESQLLRGGLRLQPCRLPPWRSRRLPRLGLSLRVSGLGVDGGNSDTAPSQGTHWTGCLPSLSLRRSRPNSHFSCGQQHVCLGEGDNEEGVCSLVCAGTQVSGNSQSRSSSVVEVDEEPGIADDEVGVFTKLIDEQLLQILQNPEDPDEPVRQVLCTPELGSIEIEWQCGI